MSEECAATPLVSVLVPVYNAEKYLRQCLDSICGQTFADLEVVAVDDGSTDSSAAILRDYAARDPRIRVVSKHNTGYGDSMNRALAEARGRYVGIVEPDDYIDPGMYAAYVEALERTGADLVKSNYYEHRERGRDERLDLFGFFGLEYGAAFRPADHPTVITVRPSIWAGLYRRSFLLDRGIDFAPTPGASFQDASFSHMCWAAADKAVVLRGAYLRYRVDNASSSSNAADKAFSVCDEFERSLDFLRGLGDVALRTFGPALGAARYGNYAWNYDRTSAGLRPAFARRWASDMADLEGQGLIDCDLLMPASRDDLRLLMADPDRFCERFAEGARWEGFAFGCEGGSSAGVPLSAAGFTVVHDAPEAPLVSVVVPLYRVEGYVRECVESLLSQTFTDFEVVCVDDGSPDASAGMARAAARGDARFTFLEQENGGQSKARNLAVEHARGEYLLFLDSDDLYTADALEKLVATAREHDLDYLDFTAATFYESAKMRRVNNEDFYAHRADVPGVMTGPELFVRYQRNGDYCCSECLHFFKRSLLDRAGLRFREGLIHEDELFSPLLVAHAQRAAFLNEALYLRRVRADSTMTKKRGIRNVVCLLQVARELEDWLRAHLGERGDEFDAALADRIGFLRGIVVTDAELAGEDDLAAYEATLQGEDRLHFQLVVRGGLAIRNRALDDITTSRTYKLGNFFTAAPRALRDRLSHGE